MNSTQTTPKLQRLTDLEPTLGAAMWARFARACRSSWRSLEAYGHARARREMLELAERCETTRPELATLLRAGCK
jgi:hypothetical protein